MFRRFVYGDNAPLFTIAAFLVASVIFVGFCWRAVRMRRGQADHFAKLPFETDTPPARHEQRTDAHAPKS